MAETRAILDASAIIAFVRRERGGDVVRELISAGFASTTPTGLAEALITCHRKGYRGTRDELADALRGFGLAVEPIVEDDAAEMAHLLARSDELSRRGTKAKSATGKLSLGDAACLAVARRLEAAAVVSDSTWELLDVPGLKVLPFR